MKIRYPTTANCLTYVRLDPEQYEVLNRMTGEVYVVDCRTAILMKKLNGKTDPYSIRCHMTRCEIEGTLVQLDKFGLLRDPAKRAEIFGTYYKTVLAPKWTRSKRKLACYSNLALLSLFIPVFITGFFLACGSAVNYSLRNIIIGLLSGMIIGIIFHEWSHAAACICYGGKVYEFGIMVHKLLPGAYTLMEGSKVTDNSCRAQIDAAGIEANLFLAGLFFILSSMPLKARYVFYYAGMQNTVMALTSFSFYEEMDGEKIVSSAIGTDDLRKKVKAIVKSPFLRKMLMCKGSEGRTKVALCYLIYLQPTVMLVVSVLFELLFML